MKNISKYRVFHLLAEDDIIFLYFQAASCKPYLSLQIPIVLLLHGELSGEGSGIAK
jgi:hypothetical protein